MRKIYLVLGGVRSGKSKYAGQLATELSSQPLYIATARVLDTDLDLQKRIQRHIADRTNNWITLEENKYLSKLDLQGRVAVIDCVTFWLTNFFVDNQYDIDITLQNLQNEFDEFIQKNNTSSLIFVSNEVGSSIHPATEIGRKFADLQGWVNQYIAKKADKVMLLVAGIPVKIK